MTDAEKREKVIKGLEYCAASCKGAWDDNNACPYLADFIKLGADHNGRCVDLLCADALALLKAQEPVEPKIIDTANSKLYHNDMFKNYYCGNCGEYLHVVNRKDMFCSQCGQAVKWDE